MRLPNFLCIGAPKSGTTWIYNLLVNHPEAFIPRKDILYFTRYYSKGISWYSSFFGDAPESVRVMGDMSANYIYSPLAAERIRRDLGCIKIMAILRNPVDLVFSYYLMGVRERRYGTDEKFCDVINKPIGHLDLFLINFGVYDYGIGEYLFRFGVENMLVLLYDDLVRDSKGTAQKICDFLDISFSDDLPYEARVNVAGRPRRGPVAWAIHRSSQILDRVGGPKAFVAVRRILGERGVRLLRSLAERPFSPEEKPRLDPEMRAFLIEVYRPSILRLQDLIGRDLSMWLRLQ